MRSARWVRNWLRRYDEGGLEGPRDLPRSGRPRRIPRETIEQIIDKTIRPKCTPAELQKRIHEETGTKLHITHIRKIMRMYDLSPKESQRVHINRAGKKVVQNWQYRFKKQVPRLEKDGFIPAMGDEAFFIHDTVSGRKYWSLRGKRIAVPYTGSHKKVAVYTDWNMFAIVLAKTRVTLIENFASNAVVQKLVDVKPDRTSPEIL